MPSTLKIVILANLIRSLLRTGRPPQPMYRCTPLGILTQIQIEHRDVTERQLRFTLAAMVECGDVQFQINLLQPDYSQYWLAAK